MSGYPKKNKTWACKDETMKAVGLIENFIMDSRTSPAWKRKTFLMPLFQE
jgi:hypothetical protein